MSVLDLLQNKPSSYLNSKLKEPDNVVGEGEEDDDDDEEPALAHVCWLRIILPYISESTYNHYLAESFHKGCVPLHRHCHGGVDAACEGDVDEGQQDGDGLEQGEVLGWGEMGGPGVDKVGK